MSCIKNVRKSRRLKGLNPIIKAESNESNDDVIIINDNNNNNNNESDSDLEIISPNKNENKKKRKKDDKKSKRKRKLPPLLERVQSKKKKQKLNDNNNNNNDNNNNNETPKKKEKKKKSKVVKEKRLARFRSVCNMATKDRIYRARTQRLFMVNAMDDEDVSLGRKYSVLGSTGNLYTVKISHLNSCTCPDFMKGNLCKHILFVMIKVLRVPYDSQHVYQKALLTDELNEIFANAPQTHFGVLANASVRNKFKKIYGGKEENNDDNEDEEVKQKPLDGECPVCMEDFEDTKGEAVVWCKGQCGQNIHTKCFKEWSDNCKRTVGKITCMYCRVDWLTDGQKKESGNIALNEGYINFANEQGMDRDRDYDDSNYYGGYYGYNRYRRGWY